MAKYICDYKGVRGRHITVYDTKIVINTRKTLGSLLSGNFNSGEKTIFLCDIVGVQFKRSGLMIGFLQFETSSTQRLRAYNSISNMFAENTFTFEDGRHGVTNTIMSNLCNSIIDRIEEIKYKLPNADNAPASTQQNSHTPKPEHLPCESSYSHRKPANEGGADFDIDIMDNGNYIDTYCPKCGKQISFIRNSQQPIYAICPWCNSEIQLY